MWSCVLNEQNGVEQGKVDLRAEVRWSGQEDVASIVGYGVGMRELFLFAMQ